MDNATDTRTTMKLSRRDLLRSAAVIGMSRFRGRVFAAPDTSCWSRYFTSLFVVVTVCLVCPIIAAAQTPASAAPAQPAAATGAPGFRAASGAEVAQARTGSSRRQKTMEVIRTPDDRFKNLPGYNFAPHYVEVAGLRMHYVDEGPRDGEVVLLLHGEPSWSYLYRKMIPIITAAGYRAIAPDFIGFGRSDKLVRPEDYSYQFHVDTLAAFIRSLDLKNVTLVCQDWGGLIGLRVAAENRDRFARIVAANTGLPTGDMPMSDAFKQWQQYSQTVPELAVGNIVKGGCRTPLPPEVVAAYDAPFPDNRYKAGARIFPKLVPTQPDDPAAPANRKAWEILSKWQKPFLTAFSDGDAITRGAELIFQQRVPGAKDQPHTIIAGAGHFLQEDKGEDLAKVVVDFINRTRQMKK